VALWKESKKVKRRALLLSLGAAVCLVAVVAAGVVLALHINWNVLPGLTPARSQQPSPYLSPQFLWSRDSGSISIAVPTTANNPGPTVQITATHERGFGPFLTGSELSQAAETDGQHTLASMMSHMQSLGWTQLFTPTRTDSFPSYGLYISFQANQHYCFVEYRVTGLDQPRAIRTLDLWFD
jgi:hypothetical protein